MRPTPSRRTVSSLRALVAACSTVVVSVGACSFDRGDRWVHTADAGATEGCHVGALRCNGALERCDANGTGTGWQALDDCSARGLVCAPGLLSCAACVPGDTKCDGPNVERCADDGSGFVMDHACDTASGVACRNGGCVALCGLAGRERSNVGCEYWGADLDNANIDDSENAAAQQYAIVVSNPQPDIAATVTVAQDDTHVGQPGAPTTIATTVVPPLSLRVLKLGPREVDGSPPGTFNQGTNTAVTRAAYRVTSSVPIIAYQFNPLDNVNVFSNDASLLKPVEALDSSGGVLSPSYVVLGWPQTIAVTDNPSTNFSTTNPINLREFLTIVATRPSTHVRVHTKARIVPGGPVAETPVDGTVDLTLDPFDVANLETGDFQADFSGSVVESDAPIVVFSGSEAADAPAWDRLANRSCCADHLEEQLDPIRTAGKTFIGTISPNRTDALIRAGATSLGHFDAPEYFRLAAATSAGATITTTLPAPNDRITLSGLGAFASVTANVDFYVKSSDPIFVMSFSPSQGASGVPFSLPGGDPSDIALPPIEQFRQSYVFLTPDQYSFDFVRILAPPGAPVLLDGDRVDGLSSCTKTAVPPIGDPLGVAFEVYDCQLGFPVIDTSTAATSLLKPGIQLDGVHQVVSTEKVGVLVDGFDKNVSYAYAAGTELTEIVPPH